MVLGGGTRARENQKLPSGHPLTLEQEVTTSCASVSSSQSLGRGWRDGVKGRYCLLATVSVWDDETALE